MDKCIFTLIQRSLMLEEGSLRDQANTNEPGIVFGHGGCVYGKCLVKVGVWLW